MQWSLHKEMTVTTISHEESQDFLDVSQTS